MPVCPIAVALMEDLEWGHPPVLEGCPPHTAAIRTLHKQALVKNKGGSWLFAYKVLKAEL